MRKLLIAVLFLLTTGAQAQNEPIVRIGLSQNAATVTIRSASAFSVQQYRTRSATVTAAEPTDCLALHRLEFLDELRRSPEVALRLLDSLAVRLDAASALK